MIDEIKLENWKNENGDIVFKCKDNATKCVQLFYKNYKNVI